MTTETSPSLYERIGEHLLQTIISEFYTRAFKDVFIGHFFFNLDRDHLIQQQTDFARAMLGGPSRYRGKALKPTHHQLPIRMAHFRRRQVILEEVLTSVSLDSGLKDSWLQLEEALAPMIVPQSGTCKT